MLKEFAQYLVSLKDNKTYEIHGDVYSDREIVRIPPHIDRPKSINVTGLDSIVTLIQKELCKFEGKTPLFIRVDDAKTVTVFSTLDGVMSRDYLYQAVCDVPGFKEGFRDYEKAIIEIRSKFIPNEGTDYLLDILSRVNKENGVTTSDNGVSQTVEARTGVSLKSILAIKPRVSLAPYRTFPEVDQPESEYLLRLNDSGEVGLFEADGGMWKLTAKRNIAGYFASALQNEIAAGLVAVML